MHPRQYALIVGAMKSGTTSVYHYLAGHPEICPCGLGEPCFFTDPETFARGHRWYEDLWDFDPARHRIAIEHSGNYTKDPYIPSPAQRIHAFAPDARIIYMVRDPVERIESHYNAALKLCWFGLEHDPLAENLLAPAFYAHQLETYERYFPREAILVLDHNELRRDLPGVMRRVLAFLDVDSDAPLALDRVHNRTQPLTRGEALSAKYRRHPLKRLVPPFLRRKVRAWMGNAPVPKFRLDDERVFELYDRIGDDLATFIARYGIDPRSERSLQYGISLPLAPADFAQEMAG